MELRDYLRVARRRWKLIIVTVVVVAGLAGAYTATATPQYSSKASVFISTTPDTSSAAYQGGLFSEQRVQSYVDLLGGLKLAQRVVDETGLPLTASEVAGKITANVVPNSVVLNIAVTDPSPARAQQINQAVVDQLHQMVAELETPPGKHHPLLKATVVDPPRLPTSPVSPKPVRNLGLGVVLGLLLGFGGAVLREVLDNSVKSAHDVTGLHDVPLLAALPNDPQVHKLPLISSLPSHAARVEAFRVLRTNLQFLDVDATSKVFVVTSSVPLEGKSTSATNAAIALAKASDRVLLVDADLRRPQVGNLLELESSVGLTTVLVGGVSLDDAIQVHDESKLDVLTAGAIPPNPAELLQSNAMRNTLAELRRRYDVVVIDAPPLLPVTDAALLADEADGAIIVVRHSKTTKEQLAIAVERLRSVDANVLGVIMNMVPRKRRMGGYGDSYGYGYGYGYAPQEESAGALTRAQRREVRDEAKRQDRNAEREERDEAPVTSTEGGRDDAPESAYSEQASMNGHAANGQEHAHVAFPRQASGAPESEDADRYPARGRRRAGRRGRG